MARASRHAYTRKWWLAIVAVLATTAALVVPRAVLADKTVNVAINVPAEVLPNPCPGGAEPVAVSGVMHIVLTTTADSSGGYHTNVSNNESFSGTGLVSGLAYQGSYNYQYAFYAGPTFPVVQTTTTDTQIISKGTTQNFIVHMDMHVTVTADGTPGATADNLRINCSG